MANAECRALAGELLVYRSEEERRLGMTIDQLVPLTNGLSAYAGSQPFMLERARVTRVSDTVDISFRIAGTDLAPRISLPARRLASSSLDDIIAILRRVVARVANPPV
jgi:hypothetical protein